MAMSTDGGNSFTPNIQVNSSSAPSPFTPSGYWMGEYLGLVVDNTHAYVGFTSSITDINVNVFVPAVKARSVAICSPGSPQNPFALKSIHAFK